MKQIVFLLSAAALLVACSEDFPERSASPAEAAGAQNIRFADYSASRPLNADENVLNIKLIRDVVGSATTVNVSSIIRTPMTSGSIEVPQQVTFEAGDTTAILAVKVSDIETFVDYKVQINLLLLPEQALNYAANAAPHELIINISRTDYAPLGVYMFDSALFYEELHLYKSPSTGNYQIPDYLSDGYNFELIAVEGQPNKFKVKGLDAGSYISWPTGLIFDGGEVEARYPKNTIEGSQDYYNAFIDEYGAIWMKGVTYYIGNELMSEGYDDTFSVLEEE